MKIITQLVILTLSLLFINTYGLEQYCSSLIRDYKANCTSTSFYIDSCCELRTLLASGVYKTSRGTFDKTAETYCDMTTGGGGWIVIQRNKKDSSVNFNRKWADYEKGFGDLNTEFWYGLDEIHCLTQRGSWEMRLDYQNSDTTWSYLHYSQFSVGSANDEYPLTATGFTGVGTDYLSYSGVSSHGMKFSTSDNDNDGYNGNCASSYQGGWWYSNSCTYIRINYQQPRIYNFNVLATEMKIRPRNCAVQ